MNIAHILPTLNPAYGGPVAVATELANAQVAEGHFVCVIAKAGKTPLGFKNFDNDTDVPDYHEVTKADEVFQFKKFDIIHIHGVWEPFLVAVAAKCRKHNIPYLVCPHGMLDDWSLAQKPFKKKLGLWTLHGRMLANASSIHVLNAHEQEVVKPKIAVMRTDVIPNGVSDFPTQSKFDHCELLNFSEPYVLFLGRLHHKKGLDYLADIWKHVVTKISDIKLVIAGPREDDSVLEFRKQIVDYGLQDSVVEMGPVYGADKFALIANCLCFVLPSRQEGFSVAVLEAMSMSRPVIISKECHFDEVKDFQAGYVCELNETEFATAIIELYEDQVLASLMGQKGYELVENKYRWSEIARCSLETYRELLA